MHSYTVITYPFIQLKADPKHIRYALISIVVHLNLRNLLFHFIILKKLQLCGNEKVLNYIYIIGARGSVVIKALCCSIPAYCFVCFVSQLCIHPLCIHPMGDLPIYGSTE
jgi:hypothetical protein